MPSERFAKLSEDKQQRIIQAAKEEFSRVPFEAVSINKIIQNAGISRGSFYTYFEDKRELVQYIFQKEQDKSLTKMKELLKEHNGDIWQAAEALCLWIADRIEPQEMRCTLSIVLQTGIGLQIEEMSKNSCMGREAENAFAEWMLENASPESLDLQMDRDRVRALVQMLGMAISGTLFQLVLHPESRDETMGFFQHKLAIMKYGVRAMA